MSSVKNGEGQDGKKFYSQKRLVRDETPAKEAERRHPAMFCPVVKQRPSQDPEKAGSSTKKGSPEAFGGYRRRKLLTIFKDSLHFTWRWYGF